MIENEPPIILLYKQIERHLLNVRQQYNRKKTVKVSFILYLTCLLYSRGVYAVCRDMAIIVAELDFLVLYI